MLRSVCVDFDRVIHSYTTPWSGTTNIPDPPNKGAFQWLTEMVERFDVVVHSCRGNDPGGVQAMVSWFRKYGLAEAVIAKLTFAQGKPSAVLYIDDRAYRFEGKFPTKEEVEFDPWHPDDPPGERLQALAWEFGDHAVRNGLRCEAEWLLGTIRQHLYYGREAPPLDCDMFLAEMLPEVRSKFEDAITRRRLIQLGATAEEADRYMHAAPDAGEHLALANQELLKRIRAGKDTAARVADELRETITGAMFLQDLRRAAIEPLDADQKTETLSRELVWAVTQAGMEPVLRFTSEVTVPDGTSFRVTVEKVEQAVVV